MIMKTLIRTFILFFCITGLASCYAGIPLKSGKSENNQTYEVSYLFEHDGVKVPFSRSGKLCVFHDPGRCNQYQE